MASLAECLKRLGIGRAHSDVIRQMAKGWEAEGVDGHEARVRSVRDLLRDTRRQQKSISDQVRAKLAPASSDNLSEQRDYGTAEKPNRTALGEHFGAKLAAGEAYDINRARKEAGELLGSRVEPGTPAAKDVDEAVEQGVVRAARKIVWEGKKPPGETFDALVDLYNRQPNLGVRTSTSMLDQAYSTPAPLAYLASNMIDVTPDSVTYDPTAGNGMLLIGATPLRGIANELNADRAEAVRGLGFNTTEHDATGYAPTIYERLIANPPFGTVKDDAGKDKTWTVDGVKTNQIDHAVALKALNSMMRRGKAVLILGSKGFETGKPKADLPRAKSYLAQKSFYDKIYDEYNVTDHFTVSGDLYRRQGAGFPVDVIVIDGKRASQRAKPYNFKGGGLPQVFNSWEDLKNAKLNQTTNRPVEPRTPVPGDSGERPRADQPSGLEGQAQGPGPKAGEVGEKPGRRLGEGVPGPVRGGAKSADTGGDRRLGGVRGDNAGKASDSSPGLPDEGRTDSGVRDGTAAGSRDVGDGVHSPDRRLGEKPAAQKPREKKQGDKETEFQVSYSPSSTAEGLGTLVPKTQAHAVAHALQTVRDRYGDIDEFVAKELGYSDLKPYFAAEQVDALAMIIARHKEGKAFVDGDQTGVGKGRVAAGIIVYAKRQGLVPVFVTQDPSLFADMVRDLTDIGQNPKMHPFEVLPTNGLTKSGDKSSIVELPDGRQLKQTAASANKKLAEAVDNFRNKGKLTAKSGNKEAQYDAIFTTYSQLQPVKGERVARHGHLDRIADKAFFILDESHNAGGSGGQQRESEDEEVLSRALIVRELLNKSSGVAFFSATYAKRPEVMDLYAKTGMTDAVAKAEDLPEAIARGKVPLQQVVSEMLTEAGAYMRRERSFDGVEFAPKVVDVGLEKADKVAEIFRAIQAFDVAKEEAASAMEEDVVSAGGQRGKDSATGSAGVQSTTFSSILWNLTNQMLLSLKAEHAAKEAVESWRRGETPVIALDNTLESGLDHYLEANPAKDGDEISFTYRDLVRRYLERSREVLVKHDVNDKGSWEQVRLTDEQLGPEGVELYRKAEELIEAFGEDIPASPIDKMRQVMEAAGMKVAEVTGRKHMVRYAPNGKAYLQSRSAKEAGNEGKQRTIRGINDGSIDAVILNRSGATGLSIHASEKFKNQKRRHMIIAQAAGNIDEFMQMLGRVHRTGQVTIPKFTLLMSNAPAETRPASVLVKKLASLNANVTASASGSVSFDAPDILNEVGNRIVGEWMAENRDINTALNDPVELRRDGTPVIKEDTAKRASGRMALMPVEVQQHFWDSVVESFNEEIVELDRIHKNPLVASSVPLEAETLESLEIFEGDRDSDSPFKQPANLEKIRARRLGEPMKPAEIKEKLKAVYGAEADQSTVIPWVRKQIEAAEQAAEEQFEKRRKRLTNDEAIASLRESIDEGVGKIKNILRSMAPGASVAVGWRREDGSSGDFAMGIVTGLKPKSADRASSPSSWVIEIALPTPDRVLRMPVSRIAHVNDEEAEVTVTAQGKLASAAEYQEFEEPPAQFEERYVATGNVLAGFAELVDEKGSVVFFTDKDGNDRRGVLLPRSFRADKWLDKKPVRFKDAEHVLRYLQGGGGDVHSPDFAIQVSMDASGGLSLRSPKSRQRSGKYTTSRKLLAAMGGDFISRGSIMVGAANPKNAKATLEAILEIGALQTGMNKDLAKQTGGIEALSEDGPRMLRPVTRQTRSTKPVDAADAAEKPTAAQDILKTWERMFGVPLRAGGFSQRASGVYKVLPEVIRLKEKHVANLAVAAHEIAHHIDKQTDLRNSIPEYLHKELKGLDYEPKNRLFEGFAEFIRHYITEHDAQKLAPEFYDWFTETWMPANERWAAPLRDAKEHARKYADQSIFQRIRSQIGYQPGDDMEFSERWKRSMRSIGSRMHRALVDRFSPLKFVQDEAAKRGMDQRAGVYDVAMAYDMSSGPNAMMALEKGVHSIVDGKLLGSKQGLWQLAEQLKTDAEYDEAVAYAYARHTLHQAKTRPGYNTGMDVADAQNWVSYIEQDQGKADRFEKFAKGLARFNNDLLQMLVAAGALSPAAKARMIAQYGDNYMPLHRVMDEGGGFFAGSGAKFVNLPPAVKGRSRLGSGRKIIDPIDATIARATYFYGRAAQARVAHRLARTLDPEFGGVEGLGGLMDRVDPKKKVHQGTINEILDTLVDQGVVEADEAKSMRIAFEIRLGGSDSLSEERLEWFAGTHGIDPSDTAAIEDAAREEPDVMATIALWRADYTPNALKATVVIHDKDGNPILYELDRELHRTVTGMDELQFTGFWKVLRGAARYFKSGAVGLSTGFGTANLIRDYVEYQGKAAHVKGLSSLGDPPAMLSRYAAYKARQMAGMPTDDALVTAFEEMGGKIYSRIGHDVESRTRSRRRKFAKSWNARWGITLRSPGESAETALEALQEAIAISDAPPRLAEMLAVAKSNGYEPVGADWHRNGHKVESLPEWLRIQMANAAGEATVNFKRVGWLGRYVESFLPFFNATAQAAYRQAVQLRSVRRLGQQNETKQELDEEAAAKRALVYLSALAATSMMVWLLRHDDDDYREQEDWIKNAYWTWGKNGITILRVPKPRDAAIVANITENILDKWYHPDDANPLTETIGQDLLGRVPTGGGLVRGGGEALIANYDYFRGRSLVPEYLQHEPKELQYTPYTLETSKAIGKVTGSVLGLSPIQVEHLLNSASGGAYRRLVGSAEAVAKGEAGPEHVPFVRGLVVNRHQGRSIDDFYAKAAETKLAHRVAEVEGTLTADLRAQNGLFNEYAALMTEIRKVEPRGFGGKRKFEYEPYIVGLARDALGRDPLPDNPNPFHDPDAPAPIKQALLDHAVRNVKRAVLSEGLPTKVRKGDESLAETRKKWEAQRQQSARWIEKHRSSPIIRRALSDVRSSKSYLDLLQMRGEPQYKAAAETWEEHQADWQRWMQKVGRAQQWLGEPTGG